MLGDLVGHELLQQVEVHRVAVLGAAGGCGSLQEGQCGVSRAPHARCGPPSPLGGPWPSAQAYPLVNELELEVAPATVWVGLRAGLQTVPLILPAAQVLAAGSGGAHAHEWGQGGARRQTWNPAPDALTDHPLPLSRLFPAPLTWSLRTTFPRKSSWPLSLRASLKILLQAGFVRETGPEP